MWYLGDGTTSTLINPTKTYAAKGTYNVKLVVTGSSGCTDSITKTITVNSLNSINNGNNSGVAPVEVTPNPSTSSSTVTFRSSSTDRTVVSIINGMGQIVKQQVVYPAASNVNINILMNISTLVNGFYFITVTDAQNKRIGFGTILKN